MIQTGKPKIIKDLSSISPSLAQTHPAISNVEEITIGTLNQAGFPSGLFRSVTNQIIIQKVSSPTATAAENSSFIDQVILPQLEADLPHGADTAVIGKTLKDVLNLSDTLSATPATTLTAQFVKAGISLPQAKEIATTLVTNNVHIYSYAIADHSPISDRSAAFKDLLVNLGLPFIQEQPGLSAAAKQSISSLIQNSSQLDAEKIYSATAQQFSQPTAPAQLSDPGFFQSPSGDLTPFMHHVFSNPISNKLKSKAGKYAMQKFIGSEVGKKITSVAAKKLGKEVVAKAVAGLTTKATASVVASAVGTPVAGIATWLSLEVISKITGFIKKHAREFAAIAAAVAGALIFGSIAAGAAIGALAFSTLSFTSATLSGFGSGLGTGSMGVSSAGARAGYIFNSLAGDIITISVAPVIITVICLPIVVAFFLIIINAGAYIVPPSAHGGVGGAYPRCWPLDSGIITSLPPHGAYNTLDAFDIGTFRQNGFPVYATHDGVVQNNVDPHNPVTQGSYGNYVKVISPLGFCTLYGHLMSFSQPNGANVLAGTQIGLSDNTGTSTGPHLHYEFQEPCLAYAGNIVGDNRIINYVPPGWSLGGSIQYPGSCFASSQGGSQTPP